MQERHYLMEVSVAAPGPLLFFSLTKHFFLVGTRPCKGAGVEGCKSAGVRIGWIEDAGEGGVCSSHAAPGVPADGVLLQVHGRFQGLHPSSLHCGHPRPDGNISPPRAGWQY
jgi:hypothetical protein